MIAMNTSLLHRTIAASLYALLTGMPLAAEPVDSSASGAHLSPPISVLSVVPVLATADVGSVRDELERRLPTGHRDQGVFWTTGQSIGCCDLQLGIHRSGGVSISYVDNALKWSVPLAINNGRVDWMKKVAFVKVRHHEDFGGGFKVSGSTGITLNPDWSVDASTTLDYSYTERPWITIHAGPLKTKISIGSVIGKQIDKKIQVMSSKIDSRIEAAFGNSIKPALDDLWEQLHQTIQISTQPSVWIQTRPAEIAFDGVDEAPDDTFSVVAAIKLYADVFVGDRPADQPRVPTPKSFDTDTDPRLAFRLHVPISELAKIAHSEFVGKSVDDELSLSQITDVTIDTMPPDRLVVDVSIKLGDIVEASVNLVVTPRFALETRELVMEVDVGDQMLIFLPFIPKTYSLDLSSRYDTMIDRIRRALSDVEISEMKTVAELGEVTMLDLYVSEKELVGHVQFAGHIGFMYDVLPEK